MAMFMVRLWYGYGMVWLWHNMILATVCYCYGYGMVVVWLCLWYAPLLCYGYVYGSGDGYGMFLVWLLHLYVTGFYVCVYIQMYLVVFASISM